MLKPYRKAKGSKMNCLFLPGIPGRIKDFAIFDEFVRNDTDIYFHQYPGTYEQEGTFSLEAARDSILYAIKELDERGSPLIIVAYSLGTLFALELNLKSFKNVIALFLFSPISGIDRESINENFLKTLSQMESRNECVYDKEVWNKEALNMYKIKDVSATLRKLSSSAVPVIFAYSEQDTVINHKLFMGEVREHIEAFGYSNFRVIASQIGDHRMDTYYSNLIKNEVLRIRNSTTDY